MRLLVNTYNTYIEVVEVEEVNPHCIYLDKFKCKNLLNFDKKNMKAQHENKTTHK